jgi:hypothetical protein
MKNSNSRHLTSHISVYRRPALGAAILTIMLGLLATNLFNVRAQNQPQTNDRAAQESSRLSKQSPLASQPVIANWPNLGRRRTTFDEYLFSFRGNERLSAEVVPVKGEGGQPTNVIVIYNNDGTVRVCIGKASACKELMS